MQHPVEQFREAARNAGYELPAHIIPDREFHRLKKKGCKALTYVYRPGNVPTGCIWDWSAGKPVFEWTASGRKLTSVERQRLKEEAQEAKAKAEAEKTSEHARAAELANSDWNAATAADDGHPYLLRKGVKAHGLRVDARGRLLVPILAAGKIVNRQSISREGDKFFLKGGRVKGLAHIIGEWENSNTIIICEGYATGAALYETTRIPCAVAFSAGNLLAVAQRIRLSWPDVKIIIASDNDWKRLNKQTGAPENIGLAKAREAAAAVGARLAVPHFGQHDGADASDFNDMCRILGADAVRECIATARFVDDQNDAHDDRADTGQNDDVQLHPVLAGELLLTKAPPRKWLVEGWLPEDQVTLLSGDGGISKSTIALQLAVAHATGTSWLGMEVKRGRVAVWSAEDDIDEMHYRLEKLVEAITDIPRDELLERLNDVIVFDATRDLDPMLATWNENTGTEPTPTFEAIKNFVVANKINLFIADSAADVFAEEINRSAVRSFLRQMRLLGCTVVLLAHPSVDGIKTGRGYSGSTHWSNAVRSRLYFTPAKASDGSMPDPDLRVLEMPKANRGRAGQKIFLRWTENGFVRAGATENRVNTLAHQVKAEDRFLELLRLFNEQGQAVSPNKGPTFAPSRFAAHPQSEGISKAAFERAMQILLSAGKIKIIEEGSPSKRRQRLVGVDQ